MIVPAQAFDNLAIEAPVGCVASCHPTSVMPHQAGEELSGGAVGVRLAEHEDDGSTQGGQVTLGDVPHTGQTNAEIIVDKHIPEPCDGCPREVWVAALQRGREALGRLGQPPFSDNYNTAE